MTNKLFRTLKITCLCMALTAALPIVSFADEQTAVNENKKVVTIIHLDENGNPLEEDKQTETTTESSEENSDTASEEKNTDDTAADSAEAEEADEENADDEEVLEAEVDVEDDLRSEIVTYALQFVGNPYVYGGTSLTNGADCSGFVLSVMANFGVSLPRTAASQSTVGTPVSLDSIQPGDLLFYQGSGGIGHVTMYIGNGQVVHASNPSTGITVSSINYRTPCCARSFF